eukprot:gene5416-3902_t
MDSVPPSTFAGAGGNQTGDCFFPFFSSFTTPYIQHHEQRTITVGLRVSLFAFRDTSSGLFFFSSLPVMNRSPDCHPAPPASVRPRLPRFVCYSARIDFTLTHISPSLRDLQIEPTILATYTLLLPSTGASHTAELILPPHLLTARDLSAPRSNDEVIATFRVPVSETSTVFDLAKSAMRRLFRSRRVRSDLSRSMMAVTGVCVGGGAQPKAEIFSSDLVSHVVVLREELIYMKLPFDTDAIAADPAPILVETRRALSPCPASHHSSSSEPGCDLPPPAPPQPAPNSVAASPQVQPDSVASKSPPESENRSTKALQDGGQSARRRLTRSAAKRLAEQEQQSNTPTDEAIAELRSREQGRLGWGPQAHLSFPANYVSSPEKLLRRRPRRKPQQQVKAQAQPPAEPVPPPSPPPPAENHPGWGPEAYKHFADNFVNSPDRLVRERMKRRRLEEEQSRAAAAAPTVISDDDVARRLSFDGAEDEEPTRRGTVGHRVQARLVGHTGDKVGPQSLLSQPMVIRPT